MTSRTRPAAVLVLCFATLLLALAVPGLAVQEAPGPEPPDQEPPDREASAEPEAASGTAVIGEGDWEPVDTFGEEIAVEVVNVEVWVTDRQGRPVTGLERDDFVILEDGEPVEIVNFAAYEGAGELAPRRDTLTVEVEPGEEEPAEAPPAALEESADPLHLAVLIDDWNLRPEDRARVFDDLRVFLSDQLQPGDRVALVVHDRALQLVQKFTDDRDRLAKSLDRVEKNAPSGLQVASEWRGAMDQINEVFRAKTGVIVEDPCDDGWGNLENVATRYAAAVQGHVQRSGGALASLSDILAGLPGRRVVLYVGNGLAQTAGVGLFQFLGELCPHRQSELGFYHREYDMAWLYQEVAERANTAGVTFYTVEAASPGFDLGFDSAYGGGQSSGASLSAAMARAASGGTSGPGGGGGGGGGSAISASQRIRPSQAAMRTREFDREGSLVLIARETGGRSFLNAGDFSRDFERLALDLRNYYSLGFTPSDPGDGGAHRLEVRLADGDGYRVRHRATYVDKPIEHRMVERVRGVAQFGGGADPLGVRLEVGQPIPEELSWRVPLRVWVPLSRLTLVPAGDEGTLRGRLRVMMSATDERGNLVPVRQKLVPVEVRGGENGLVGDQLIEIDVDLGAGEHTVVLGVRDTVGGETSYVRREFPVPGAAPAAAAAPGADGR